MLFRSLPQTEDVIYSVSSIESGCVALSFRALIKVFWTYMVMLQTIYMCTSCNCVAEIKQPLVCSLHRKSIAEIVKLINYLLKGSAS